MGQAAVQMDTPLRGEAALQRVLEIEQLLRKRSEQNKFAVLVHILFGNQQQVFPTQAAFKQKWKELAKTLHPDKLSILTFKDNEEKCRLMQIFTEVHQLYESYLKLNQVAAPFEFLMAPSNIEKKVNKNFICVSCDKLPCDEADSFEDAECQIMALIPGIIENGEDSEYHIFKKMGSRMGMGLSKSEFPEAFVALMRGNFHIKLHRYNRTTGQQSLKVQYELVPDELDESTSESIVVIEPEEILDSAEEETTTEPEEDPEPTPKNPTEPTKKKFKESKMEKKDSNGRKEMAKREQKKPQSCKETKEEKKQQGRKEVAKKEQKKPQSCKETKEQKKQQGSKEVAKKADPTKNDDRNKKSLNSEKEADTKRQRLQSEIISVQQELIEKLNKVIAKQAKIIKEMVPRQDALDLEC
jgi:chemotaxis protein histidine kinase CheA